MFFTRVSFLIAEISTSQHDIQGDLLIVNSGCRASQFTFSTQKSLSDTDIDKSSRVSHWLTLPDTEWNKNFHLEPIV